MRKPYYSHNDITLFHGNALDVLTEMEPESVHCCVTSPPYFSLRDYGVAGQIGLEDTPDEFIAKLVEVFREVRRALRDDGTLFVNIGDSYAGSGKGPSGYNGTVQGQDERQGFVNRLTSGPGCKPKDLIGIPWMLAFALRADGWWLRSEIIWAKNNCMPESVTDRPTRSHEYIFLLSKRARYYYDAEAIKEPATEPAKKCGKNSRANVDRDVVHGTAKQDAIQLRRYVGFNERYDFENPPSGRNKRSVWTVSTEPNKLMHFACFPTKLVEPCILAGTSERGCCPECGKPWGRVTERQSNWQERKANGAWAGNVGVAENYQNNVHGQGMSHDLGPVSIETVGWQPTCKCPPAEPIPCTVLDPFCGVGTTGVVSIRHRRKFVGIDLKQEYLDLAVENMDGRPIRLPLEVS